MDNITHLYKISPHIYSRCPEDELFKRLKRIDLCVLDLDECITPAVTQVELIKEMLRLILLHPLRLRDRKLLLSFAPKSLWSYITVMILRRKILRNTVSGGSNIYLSTYPRLVKNIPKDYFYQGSQRLPRLVYGGVKEALENLTSFCRVGIITSASEPIVTEHIKALDKDLISFYNCNHIEWAEKEKVLVFKDLDRARLIRGNVDKAKAAESRFREFNSKFLLTIGHDEDDTGIAEIAKQSGGLAIGFNPKSNVIDAFDVVVKAKNWHPINDWITNMSKAL